jgi:hypothetical protein
MKFCTGWYPHPDVQLMYWDGGAPVEPDFQDVPQKLADVPGDGVASEDELMAKKAQILARA